MNGLRGYPPLKIGFFTFSNLIAIISWGYLWSIAKNRKSISGFVLKWQPRKVDGQAILLYKKRKIWAQNSTYFYYYRHIKVHLNGFIVQILVETNNIDHIKPFTAVWLGHRLRLKYVDFLHFFTKTRFSQNAILALFQNYKSKISKTVARNIMKFYTHNPYILG